jgi:hypothetical protein
MLNFLARIPTDVVKEIASFLIPLQSPPLLSNAVTTDWLQKEFVDTSNLIDSLTQVINLRAYKSWIDILSLNADCHISVNLRDGAHEIRNSMQRTNKNTHTRSVHIAVQFNNGNANHRLWKNNFIWKATHVLDNCNDVDSLIFDECSSNVESIIDKVAIETLSRLTHIGIHKHNIEGKVETLVLEKVIRQGTSLERVEFLCDGVTWSVFNSFSPSQLHNLVVVRFQLCLCDNRQFVLLCDFLEAVSPAIQHLQISQTSTLCCNYHLEYVAKGFDRSSIFNPSIAVRNEDPSCEQNMLVMTGNLSWLWPSVNHGRFSWLKDVASISWDLATVSQQTFVTVLSSNKCCERLVLTNFEQLMENVRLQVLRSYFVASCFIIFRVCP